MIRAVAGILQKENKILITERPLHKPYAGYWEFPGGKIEANETSLHALKRELQEELGIFVNDAEFWFEHTHQYPDKKVFLEIWRVADFTGEPEGKEEQKLCWIMPNEIPSLQLLEGNIAIIKRIITHASRRKKP